ncbi:hypothetical protein ACNJQJ_22990, partial [Mycobacterium tuberculosis]
MYLCTDARRERGDLAQFAEAALAGGVDIIQLRVSMWPAPALGAGCSGSSTRHFGPGW